MYIGREPQVGNFQVCDAISVVNGQAAYTMQVNSVNVSPETANHMLVSLNGVLQAPGSSYTVSGSTITFASNLVTGDVINFIHILGSVLDLGVPSDSTVSLAKLTATGTKDATTFLRGDNTFASAGGANTPAFAAYLDGSAQSFSDNSDTKVQCNAEKFDTDSAYDNSSNYRFTVPSGKAGKYYFHGGAYIYGSSDGILKVTGAFLRLNNSTNINQSRINRSGSEVDDDISHHVQAILDLSVGDYVELYAYADTSSGNPFLSNGVLNTFFEGFKLI